MAHDEKEHTVVVILDDVIVSTHSWKGNRTSINRLVPIFVDELSEHEELTTRLGRLEFMVRAWDL